jgi:hypothetical protein
MPSSFPRWTLFFAPLLLFGLAASGCGPEGPSNTPPPGEPDLPPRLVRGQTLYVPAYSHIYVRDGQRTMNLGTTLSIRNTSPEAPITLTTLDYYDSNGARVRPYTKSGYRLQERKHTNSRRTNWTIF